MTPQRAKDAIEAINLKDSNKFGFYLHTRHKQIVLHALDFYIRTIDRAK